MSAPLKLVFYRPHAEIWFKSPVRSILRNRRTPNKYAPLFDNALKSDARIYLAPQFFDQNGVKTLLKSMFDLVELIAWCILNHVSLRKVGFVIGKRGLLDKDALFLMHYGNFTHESRSIAQRGELLAQYLAKLPIYKVVHMTHYAYNPVIGADNLMAVAPDLLVAENNLWQNSQFFKKYFNELECAFKVLPYTPAARFKMKTPFRERVSKLVVTGSITYKMRDEEFVRFYQQNELQPLRRVLYENAEKYKLEMKCLILDLNASRTVAATDSGKGIVKRICHLFDGGHPQKVYYGTDIVATYNEYMMFAVPEEICDLPAIGFVEGMACGCAYIGLDKPMYRDIGLIPGVHYVAYDGAIADLMDKVRHYQSNIGELEAIADQGRAFALKHLSTEVVYQDFLETIKSGSDQKKTQLAKGLT